MAGAGAKGGVDGALKVDFGATGPSMSLLVDGFLRYNIVTTIDQQVNECNVVITIINHPFGNVLYHLYKHGDLENGLLLFYPH